MSSLIAALFVLPLLLISSTAKQQVAASPMADMKHDTTSTKLSDCVSACSNQLQPVVTAINEQSIKKEKDFKSEPVLPYYVQIIKISAIIILLTSAYLLRYLRWRPPDIFKLHELYRI